MLSFRLIKPWIVLTIALMSLTFYQVEAQQFVVKEGSSLNARSGPGTNYAKVARIAPKTEVEELERRGLWSNVRIPSGQDVWVHNGYLEKGPPQVEAVAPKEDLKPKVFVQTGHNGEVRSVAFSPDGSLVATASWDNTVKLWEAKTGKQIRTFKGHENGVNSVAFSPTGDMIATGSIDETAKVWDVKSGEQITSFGGHVNDVRSVAFTPDSLKVLSGSWDGTAKLWDAKTGKLVRTFKRKQDTVHAVAISPNGKYALTGSWYDGTVTVWNIKSGRRLRTLKGFEDSVVSVAFSDDSKLIAGSANDGVAIIWNAKTGRRLSTLSGETSFPIDSLDFDPSGTKIVTGCQRRSKSLPLGRSKSRPVCLIFGYVFWPLQGPEDIVRH